MVYEARIIPGGGGALAGSDEGPKHVFIINLVQIVNEPTRGENVLDLCLTSNHTLVNDISILLVIADHDMVVANASTNMFLKGQSPR